MNDTNVPATTGLIRKLAEVMAAVERVPKRGRNEFHKYDYAMEADIVAVVRDELAQRNVMLIPSVQNHERHEIKNKRDERVEPLTVLHMTFTFIDGDSGEREAHAWLGVGQDGGDKGVYKAMTGAAKYFLLKTFLMPTGDDPEAEVQVDRTPDVAHERPRHEPIQRTQPQPAPRQPLAAVPREREPGEDDEPSQAPPRPNGNGRTISEPQQKRLYVKATQVGRMTKDQYRDFVRRWGYDTDRAVLVSDYDRMVAEAEAGIQ